MAGAAQAQALQALAPSRAHESDATWDAMDIDLEPPVAQGRARGSGGRAGAAAPQPRATLITQRQELKHGALFKFCQANNARRCSSDSGSAGASPPAPAVPQPRRRLPQRDDAPRARSDSPAAAAAAAAAAAEAAADKQEAPCDVQAQRGALPGWGWAEPMPGVRVPLPDCDMAAAQAAVEARARQLLEQHRDELAVAAVVAGIFARVRAQASSGGSSGAPAPAAAAPAPAATQPPVRQQPQALAWQLDTKASGKARSSSGALAVPPAAAMGAAAAAQHNKAHSSAGRATAQQQQPPRTAGRSAQRGAPKPALKLSQAEPSALQDDAERSNSSSDTGAPSNEEGDAPASKQRHRRSGKPKATTAARKRQRPKPQQQEREAAAARPQHRPEAAKRQRTAGQGVPPPGSSAQHSSAQHVGAGGSAGSSRGGSTGSSKSGSKAAAAGRCGNKPGSGAAAGDAVQQEPAGAGPGTAAGDAAPPTAPRARFPANALAPADAALDAVVEAAGLPALAAGPGELRQCTASGVYGQDVPCVSAYRHGQGTGHHAKLFRKTNGGDGWQQLTTSCHDCQHQHVKWKCPCKSHDRQASYCNRCLHYRYRHTAFSVAELHQACPLCRGICTCKACLRQPDHKGRVVTGEPSPQQQARYGRYLTTALGPHLAQWLAQQQDQARAAGFSSLKDVPVEELSARDRVNCDRCGTNLVGLCVHCSECGWDLCCDCMKELRQHQQPQAAHTSGGDSGSGSFVWTCCSPVCGQEQDNASSESSSESSSSEEEEEADGDPQQQEAQQAGAAAGAAGDDAAAVAASQRRLHGRDLQCVAGGQQLSVQLLLPEDLVAQREQVGVKEALSNLLDSLQAIADKALTAGSQTEGEPAAAAGPTLADCPLLPSSAPLPLLGADVSELTLEQLQGRDWWRVLPQPQRDAWRRKAQSDAWLFTPALSDLELPDGGPSEALALACLARALFWARWQLGEPVIVRNLKGRIPWDPDTMRRAVNEVRAMEERVSVLDCANFGVTSDITPHAFFRGYTEGYWRRRAAAAAVAAAAAAANAAAGSGAATAAPQAGEHAAAAAGAADAGPPPPPPPDSTAGLEAPFMLKVKDWPPTKDFAKELPRHMMDFIERLPLRVYTDPRLGRGHLNLASHLTQPDNPTDLGPKCYLAYGRWQEAHTEGDSVTKLHLDMTDAFNILVDVAPGGDALLRAARGQPGAPPAPQPRCGDAPAQTPGYGGAGAVWHIYDRRPSAVAALSSWLVEHAGEFTHQGAPVKASRNVSRDPVMCQAFMLLERHRRALAADTGIEAWAFEQYLDEGVFVPGGCPHQVRNLASCCKVAVDFVSPEGVASCMQQRERLRCLDLELGHPLKGAACERQHAEKLQSSLILLRGALTAAGMAADPQRLLQGLEPELPESSSHLRKTGGPRSSRKKALPEAQQADDNAQPGEPEPAVAAAGAKPGQRRRASGSAPRSRKRDRGEGDAPPPPAAAAAAAGAQDAQEDAPVQPKQQKTRAGE